MTNEFLKNELAKTFASIYVTLSDGEKIDVEQTEACIIAIYETDKSTRNTAFNEFLDVLERMNDISERRENFKTAVDLLIQIWDEISKLNLYEEEEQCQK